MAKLKGKRRRGSAQVVALMNEINAGMGRPVLKLGTDEQFQSIRIPTGSLTIDRITGGGFVLGRHVELSGDESACKSFIAYRTMALSQQRGNICALIDPEHSYDADWFSHLGGYPEQLLLEQPETAEEAVGSMMMLAGKAEQYPVEVIAIDSIASLVPREETEKDPREGDARIAGQARMMSRALRLITVSNTNRTLFLWTNQERTNIGIMFGNPKTTPGGKAMRFYATTRIEMRKDQKVKVKRKKARKGKLSDVEVPRGNWVQVLAAKEKSTRPYGQGAFIFDTDHGRIDLASELVQLGLDDGVVERNGNTFTYEGIEGEEWKGTWTDFCKTINEDADLQAELIQAIEDQTVQLARVGNG